MPPAPKRKDPRAFINVVTGYFDSPKIDALMDSFPTAVFMHIRSMMYAGEHLTDGHVPAGKIKRQLGADDDDVQSLLDIGLWHETGHTCNERPQPSKGMVYVHDYLAHNRSKAEAQKESSKKAEAGRKGAEARWAGKKGKPDTDTDRDDESPF